MKSTTLQCLALLALFVASPAWRRDSLAFAQEEPARPAAEEPKAQPAWRSLFNGKDLTGWKKTNFGGEGPVEVKDGRIEMEFGSPLTGITYTGNVPKDDYEVSLRAMKTDGIDFFCALTFPVQDSHCSLVVGGWGGAVVGLSSLDGQDASMNDTTSYMDFKDDQWYAIRVRVAKDRVQAWIDDKQVVDQDVRGKQVATRNEVNLSKPLGVCAFETRSVLRDIRIRSIERVESRE